MARTKNPSERVEYNPSEPVELEDERLEEETSCLVDSEETSTVYL